MHLTDGMKQEIAAMIQQYGANRRGLVVSYQAQPPMAKVQFQPAPPESDGAAAETGWIPVLSHWVGPGWGMHTPLQAGDQVLLVCEEADGMNYAVAGRYYSDADQAPPAEAGECHLVHSSGAAISLNADGSISLLTHTLNITAPGGGNATVNITGSLNVSVETTTAGKAFTPHTHPYLPGTGGQIETGPPQG
jgi:phage baseplate assembly protein gpV